MGCRLLLIGLVRIVDVIHGPLPRSLTTPLLLPFSGGDMEIKVKMKEDPKHGRMLAVLRCSIMVGQGAECVPGWSSDYGHSTAW